jgi:hypothetical protein
MDWRHHYGSTGRAHREDVAEAMRNAPRSMIGDLASTIDHSLPQQQMPRPMPPGLQPSLPLQMGPPPGAGPLMAPMGAPMPVPAMGPGPMPPPGVPMGAGAPRPMMPPMGNLIGSLVQRDMGPIRQQLGRHPPSGRFVNARGTNARGDRR